MNYWFVEVLDKKDNWIHMDNQQFTTFLKAKNHAYNNGLTDEKYYYRINMDWDNHLVYYGPCH